MSAHPVYFTTHQVSRMLGVSLPTVVNWIKADKLRAHRTPGGHRRISREALLAFAETFAYPVPPELGVRTGPRKVLVVDQERDFFEMLDEFADIKGGFELRFADGPFLVGLEVGRFTPDLILVDLGLPTIDPIRLARLLPTDARGRAPALLGILPFPDARLEERARAVGYAQLLRKPVSLDGVWAALEAAFQP